jgi:hypothetical protein
MQISGNGAVCLALLVLGASGCGRPARQAVGDPATDHGPGMDHAAHMAAAPAAPVSDSAFAALQARGRLAMGVDQYTSVHRFESLSDGGRIELQRDSDDSVGVATIRAHLRGIAAAFGAGDFTTPAFVHMQQVPGAAVMAARRALITYTVTPLPRGGALRISTRDSAAVAAIASFMAFQRSDHRVR